MKQFKFELDGTVTVMGKDDPLTQQDYEDAIQVMLDATAKANGDWKSMDSARAGAKPINPNDDATVIMMKNQAQKLDDFYFAVWAKAYLILGEVQAGTRAVPTLDELLGLLPEYV